MANKMIEELKEYTAVLVGPRKVSAYDGKAYATYKSQKGHGHLVINVGDVKIGDNCENQIDEHLRSFVKVIEQLQTLES